MSTKQTVTPGRRTHVRFDVPEPVLIQQGYWNHRYAKDMGLTKESKQKNVTLTGELCWQLTPIAADVSQLHEQTSGQAGIQRPILHYQLPSGYIERNVGRDSSDFPNAMLGSTGVASSSDPFVQKEVASGDNWDSPTYRMDGDQSSYPGDTEGATVAMDRTVVSLTPDTEDGALTLRFSISGGHLSAKNLLIRKYFVAPATGRGPFSGKGYYCVLLYGDGRAVIKQLADTISRDGSVIASNQWLTFGEFRFANPNQVAEREHYLEIRKHKFTPSRGSLLGFVDFYTQSGPSTKAPGGNVGIFAKRGFDPVLALHFPCKWDLPTAAPSPSGEKYRVDISRTIRPRIQISKPRYPSTGYLFDDPIALTNELGQGSDADRVWYVTWFGDVPTGTSIDVQLYDYSADPEGSPTYSAVSSGSIGSHGGWKGFLLPETTALPTLQVKFILSTTDPEKTPSLYARRITRKAIIEQTSAELFEITGVSGLTELEIIGPDKDPSHESASLVIADLKAEYERLRRRGSLPVEISTEYPGAIDWSDVASAPYRSVLFRGYAESPRTSYPGVSDPMNRPMHVSANRRDISLSCYGMYLRGSEQFALQQVDFGWARDEDSAAGKGDLPWKVTDAIRFALRQQGFPDDYIDLPDLAVRLFPNDSEGIRVQPGQSWIEFAVQIASDYLGATLVFDPNASSSSTPANWWGMWRLLLQPSLTANRPLMYFAIQHPGGLSGTWVPAADAKAWTSITYGGRTIPGTFVSDHPSELVIDPPAANNITVVGGVTDGQQPRAMCVAPNPNSYNAVRGQTAPDPDGEDYIGRLKPLYYVDSQLSSGSNDLTEAAVRFVTARLFQSLAHAKKTLPIYAPLVLVTDETDTKQRRPRAPRWGDEVVLFDRVGNPYKAFITSCNPTFEKDTAQMALYEIVFPPETATDIEL
jgi:hypothetical protein